MSLKFAAARACRVAAILLAVTAVQAAETKSPLIGATREQVVARNGDPRSVMAAGVREILFYANERVILRNGVVVDVERVFTEPARKAPEPTPAPSTPTAQTGASGAAGATGGQATTTPSAPAASTAPANQPAGSITAGQDGAGGPAPDKAGTTAATTGAAATPVTPPPPEEPKLEFKSIRRPGQEAPRPIETATTPTPAPVTAPAATTSTPASVLDRAQAPSVSATKAPASSATAYTAPVTAPASSTTPTTKKQTQPTTTGTKTGSKSTTVAAEEKAKTPEEEAAELAAQDKAKRKKLGAVRKRLSDLDEDIDEPTTFFTAQTYLIAFFTIVGGAAILWWRHRQRQLALEATAVSRTPFTAPVSSSGTGARFSPDILARLEWKRFEELVAAYYSKTGVIASRTKSGPTTPVHIKISWKGESRPFAYVQCIPHPTGLIDAAPIQQLVAALAVDDIRRGYVVSSGKFNVNARDLAEEKHITLLSGDIFLEKLNALPDLARTEIMQEAMAGDPATPSCPKCDGKMIRSPGDSSKWVCPTHGDEIIPSWR